MKTYTSLKETPLRFHRIYAAVVLPVDLFLNLYSLITIVSNLSKDISSLWSWITLISTSILLVLIFSAFRGLLVFKKRGLYSLIGILFLQLLDNGYTFYLSYISKDYVFTLSSALSIGILFLIFFYYFLRRKLFTREGIDVRAFVERQQAAFNNSPYTPPVNTDYEEIKVEEEEEEVGEYDCPRCGFHITDGKVFCPKCGAQTRSVRR